MPSAARKIDPDLIAAARPQPGDCLTMGERIAIAVMARDGVNSRVLAKAFGHSPNTLYYSCLTGNAPSYPNSARFNRARETQAIIDRMGINAARAKYVTEEMVDKVSAILAAKVEVLDRRRRA